jgi:hypothetical protein
MKIINKYFSTIVEILIEYYLTIIGSFKSTKNNELSYSGMLHD